MDTIDHTFAPDASGQTCDVSNDIENATTDVVGREHDLVQIRSYGSVGSYIADIVSAEHSKALAREQAPATADEWIDAVKSAGLKLSISYDIYTGTPLSFGITPAAGGSDLLPPVDKVERANILAALHRRSVGDPLLDLVQRTRSFEANPVGIDGGEYGLDLLNGELKAAPAATSIPGVITGLDYGFEQVKDFDRCGDGVLVAAITGLGDILAKPVPEIIQQVAGGRPEVSGHLHPLILAYEAAYDAFNGTHLDNKDPERKRLEAAYLKANDNLQTAVKVQGLDTTSWAEATAAARLATREYHDDDELAAGLALAALAYFVGPETVS